MDRKNGQEEKTQSQVKVKKKGTNKIAIMIIIIIGLILASWRIILTLSQNNSTRNIMSGEIKPMITVEYPEGYGFEDYASMSKIREQNQVDENFSQAVNDFAFKTSSEIFKKYDNNINYSPLSLYYALGIATTGAGNDTEKELQTLLGASDKQSLADNCRSLYRNIYKDNEIGKLKIADSVWLDNNGTVFKKSFADKCAKDFYASVFSVDFNDNKTYSKMSEWVADNTNNSINPQINSVPNQIMSIMNTVYYCDQWVDEFDINSTKQGDFYTADNNTVTCDFMNSVYGSAPYVKGENFTRSSLTLKNSSEMIFILPDKGVSLKELITNEKSLKNLFESGEINSGEVTWKIPKFEFDSDLSLKDTLTTTGITKAFCGDADFTDMTKDQAFISDISQNTHIAINEKGVEASAFTDIQYAGSACPEGKAEMILDRPFIYGIKADNNTLLFIGICNNPTV